MTASVIANRKPTKVGIMRPQNIAVVGATGAVGVEILRVLERRNFPVASLKLLASKRSAGKTLEFKGKPYKVEELTAESFKGVDIAFFSAGATRSREFVPAAKAAGAVVIDNSSAFRMDPNMPLVVPEVNPGDLRSHKGVIANPNCTAAILAHGGVADPPGRRHRKIVVSTYQSASGAGAAAMQELEDQMHEYAEGKEITHRCSRTRSPSTSSRTTPRSPRTATTTKRTRWSRRRARCSIAPDLAILPTCVRVPVLRAHSESISLELEAPMSPEEARALLARSPGIKIVDDPASNHFPMPIEASGDLDVHVGRIRRDLTNPNGLALFVAGDQLLKGAAWNAVQIAEELAKLEVLAAE